MEISVMPSAEAIGIEAARLGGAAITEALARRGAANIVVATGLSQVATLERLTADPSIDWTRVTAFHLDEYVGVPANHNASFVGYLRKRLVAATNGRARLVEIDGMATNPEAEAARLSKLLERQEIDVCFAGIGENCHLAFNDPPADFDTASPYLVVELDTACRQQQVDEGWFAALEDVPKNAITMSINRIMSARKLILSVPDARKAEAVRNAVEGEVDPDHPASILQRHGNCTVLLDSQSAQFLSRS